MNLLPHHQAWLDSRPDRTVFWLKARLKEGFHIHHIDGDHGNNNPDNLVLIEGVDHMKFHRGWGIVSALRPGMMRSPHLRRLTTNRVVHQLRSALAYDLRRRGHTWRAIEEHICSEACYGASASGMAKRHAKASGRAWPVPIDLPPSRSLPKLVDVKLESIALCGQQDGPKPWERAA